MPFSASFESSTQYLWADERFDLLLAEIHFETPKPLSLSVIYNSASEESVTAEFRDRAKNAKVSFDKWMIWVVSGPHKRVHCWKKEITIPYVVREVRNMIEDVRRGLKVKPLIRRFIINQTDSLFFKLYLLATSLIPSICNSVTKSSFFWPLAMLTQS